MHNLVSSTHLLCVYRSPSWPSYHHERPGEQFSSSGVGSCASGKDQRCQRFQPRRPRYKDRSVQTPSNIRQDYYLVSVGLRTAKLVDLKSNFESYAQKNLHQACRFGPWHRNKERKLKLLSQKATPWDIQISKLESNFETKSSFKSYSGLSSNQRLAYKIIFRENILGKIFRILSVHKVKIFPET